MRRWIISCWRVGIVIVVAGGLLGGPLLTQAQGTDGVVPDLTGMNVPAAAAALNRLGLALGTETGVAWSEGAAGAPNTIIGQSVPAGQPVTPGAAVDITVARELNALLIYDDNDLTLVNRAGVDLDLTGLTFNSVDGNSPASFAASRWAGALRSGQCGQMWSEARNGPKGLDECAAIQNWLWTGVAGEHFWTGTNGATQFSVVQNGIERGQCPTGTGRCELYLAVDSADDVTGYLYFSYAADRLVVWNNSPDRWMPLRGAGIKNYAIPGGPFDLALDDPAVYGRNANPVANLGRLAPGQCLLFTAANPAVSAPPEDCNVVARLAIGPDLIFWAADFGVIRPVDEQERTCPAASPDGLRLCILPG